MGQIAGRAWDGEFNKRHKLDEYSTYIGKEYYPEGDRYVHTKQSASREPEEGTGSKITKETGGEVFNYTSPASTIQCRYGERAYGRYT